MRPNLSGRVALVTGAGGGIGTALVAELLDHDATVVATSREDRMPAALDAMLTSRAPERLIAPVRGLGDVDLDTWQATMAVNFTAPFLLAQAALPGMARRGFGRIRFTSSAAASIGGFVGPRYSASKAALHGLVAALSTGYASHVITVNAIAPALIAGTLMIDDDVPWIDPARILVGRLGQPDEVANSPSRCSTTAT